MSAGRRSPQIDPITFEVLNNAFRSIVDEMGALLQTVAFSLVVSEGRDYSGTICTASGDLVSSGSTDLPAHLGTIPFTLKGLLEWIDAPAAEWFEPGDLAIINDAYIGGTHNNDVRIVMPVWHDGEIIAFVQNSAHWTDIGGGVPGTFDPNARSSHGEGLIIPPLKLVRRGELDRDLVRMILRNVRMPELAYGDLLAQVGASRLGARRLLELVDRHGRDLVLAEMQALIAHSEKRLRTELSALPDGTWSWDAKIDRDPGADDDDPRWVCLDLSIAGDRMTLDFSRSSPQCKGAINGPRAVLGAAAVAALKAVFADVPMNQGLFNAVEFVAPPGLIVTAEYPAPISGMAGTCYPSIIDCVLGCLIQITPERSMAGMCGLCNIVFGGYDPRPGYEREFVSYVWLEGGWGGRPAKKDNHTAMTLFGSSATNQPVEMQERVFPVRYDCYRYEPDSAGAGRHRGGFGVTRQWRLTHADAVISDIGDRETRGSWGFAGGQDSLPNSFVYAPGTEEEESIGMFRTGMRVRRDRPMRYHHSGGGGYGPPEERPPAWVLDDVVDGLVSVAAAESVYRVAIVEAASDPYGFVLDETRTADLRRQAAS
ncbi:MAG: hydantoinase B/oxoprolinase family protein [Gaiella sp.]